MRGTQFMDLLAENPVVAAVKDDRGLSRSLQSDCKAVFVLYGDLLTVGVIAARIKEAGKLALIHVDLVEGLASRDVAVRFVAKNTRADGILSTKTPLVRAARAQGLLAIQRFFILDSMSLLNFRRQAALDDADAVEILPGVMPKVIARLAANASRPIIAGGLISDKEDVIQALNAGAVAVSSSNEDIWFL